MLIKKAKNIYNNVKLWTEELGTGKKTIRGRKLRLKEIHRLWFSKGL